MTQDNIYLTIILIILAIGFIYRTWGIMKAINIFMKNPSNKSSDYLTVGPMAAPRGGNIKFIYGIAASILLSFLGVYNVIQAGLQPVGQSESSTYNAVLAGYGTMLLALLILIAAFLHILMNKIDEVSSQITGIYLEFGLLPSWYRL